MADQGSGRRGAEFTLFVGPPRHFRSRVLEWVIAAMMLSWGLLLMRPGESLAQPVYHFIHEQWNETVFATMLTGVGVSRLIALFAIGHAGALVRMFAGCLSAALWMQIFLSLAHLDYAHPGLAVYSWLIVADIYCIYWAGKEFRYPARQKGR